MKKLLPILFFLATLCTIQAQTIDIKGPERSGIFGSSVTVLTNGNYVVTDPYWDNGVIEDVGAVYLYNGKTHELISTLTGSTKFDRIGFNYGAITPLSNGNFLVNSYDWDNGTIKDAGAVTWCNGTTGTSGVVSRNNSLVGSSKNDGVGSWTIIFLPNSNYIVRNPNWDNGTIKDAGAVTWCNGSTGITGEINSTNSLVGATVDESLGYEVVVLTNGNYVVASSGWANGINNNVGAVIWCNGETGRTGFINSGNSLVGSSSEDFVGSEIIFLNNGNYVVRSPYWHNGTIPNAGAVTWCNGSTGTTGEVNSRNSLVGSSINDYVGGYNVFLLESGNYVVHSRYWNNPKSKIRDAGAITWCNGTTGTTGEINESNSLVGNYFEELSGDVRFTQLKNGNYIVAVSDWDNGALKNVGAVTWCDGATGRSGFINSSNSLIGTKSGDQVGENSVIPLCNGNYVVSSSLWDNGQIINAGAVTWCNGNTGRVGEINSENSLVGSSIKDNIGYRKYASVVYALYNGNYVVCSPDWDNGAIIDAGAATWCDGATGRSGFINNSNSLVGTKAGHRVGLNVTPLNNNNYVISSPYWSNGNIKESGAVTWSDGTKEISGTIDSNNSLLGADGLITQLSNGNYLVLNSYWDNGGVKDVGAITWCDGLKGATGIISKANSLVGSTAGDFIGRSEAQYEGLRVLNNGNYIVKSRLWDNGSIQDAGAITWCSGITGKSGEINSENSLVGSYADDEIGGFYDVEFNNSNYVVNNWMGDIGNDQSITLGNGATGVSGIINKCNSIIGSKDNSFYRPVYNEVYDYLIVGREAENMISIFNPTGQSLAIDKDNKTQEIAGVGSAVFVNNDCRLIATLATTGASPVSGITSAKVWVENTQPAQIVKRHYEITPNTDADKATAKITLYFTQQEFDDFNAVNTVKLPMNSDDAAGKANILIEQASGVSSNGTGLPDSYSGNTININPADENIVWNSLYNRWEISFDIIGFGGFFLKTTTNILPINWLSISGAINNYKQAVISFKVSETNVATFIIEKSADSRSFNTIGTISSKGNGVNTYSFTDTAVLNGTAFYRIKQVDRDNHFSYSSTVRLSNISASTLMIYPNPAKGIVTISNAHTGSEAVLTDASGRPLRSIKINSPLFTIDMSAYPSGVYILKCNDGSFVKIVKE